MEVAEGMSIRAGKLKLMLEKDKKRMARIWTRTDRQMRS